MGPVVKTISASISRLSTVEAGSLYEQHVLNVLTKYGFTLKSCGGPNDKGVDLFGHLLQVPVIVQCKQYQAQPLTPSVLRELYGVIAARPGHFGLLVCCGGVKAGSLSFLQSANLPLGVMTLLTQDESSQPTSLTLNQAARRALPFLRQTCVYYRDGNGLDVKVIDLHIT